MKLSLALYVIVIVLVFLQASFAQSEGEVIDDEEPETSAPGDETCKSNQAVFRTCVGRQEATLGSCPGDDWRCRCDAYRDLQNCYLTCDPPLNDEISRYEGPRQDTCKRAEEQEAREQEDREKENPETEEEEEDDEEDQDDSQTDESETSSTDQSDPEETTTTVDEADAAVKIQPIGFALFLVIAAALL